MPTVLDDITVSSHLSSLLFCDYSRDCQSNRSTYSAAPVTLNALLDCHSVLSDWWILFLRIFVLLFCSGYC